MVWKAKPTNTNSVKCLIPTPPTNAREAHMQVAHEVVFALQRKLDSLRLPAMVFGHCGEHAFVLLAKFTDHRGVALTFESFQVCGQSLQRRATRIKKVLNIPFSSSSSSLSLVIIMRCNNAIDTELCVRVSDRGFCVWSKVEFESNLSARPCYGVLTQTAALNAE